MKITYVLTWADAVGGTERTVLRQASWMAQRHEVEVLSIFRSRQSLGFPVDDRVRVRYLVDTTTAVPAAVVAGLSKADCAALAAQPSRLVQPGWEGAFSALTDLEVEAALREIDADVVVSTTPALLALVTTLVPRRVVTVHQEHRVSELRGSSGGPLRLHTPRLDALVLLSERTRMWFADLLGDAAPHLEVIGNASDGGYVPGSTRQTRTIVWAGRLSAEKQPVHAIEAFAQVSSDHPDWTLRLFGGGERGSLEQLIAGHRLADRVQLMGVSTSMTHEWAKASIGLLTSRVEAYGMTLVEAGSAGVPVVAYDCPNGPREVVDDGVTGLLVSPDDVGGLAAALRKLIEDDSLRHQMGEAAAVTAARFSPEAVLPRWEALFEELLAGRDAPDWVDRRRRAMAEYAARSAVAMDVDATPGVEPVSEMRDADEWAAGVRAAMPGMVSTRGQLTQIHDDLGPDDVARHNLDLVTAALTGAGVPHFLVRQSTVTFRVAVRELDRDAALAALVTAHHRRPTYVEAFNQRGRTLGVWPAHQTPDVAVIAGAAWVRVFEPFVTASRTLRFGAVYGCVLEFWQDDESESGEPTVTAPSVTPIGLTIPLSALTAVPVRVGGREYRTVEPFTRTLPTEITFPVDVVYTWVDGDDEAWRERRRKTLAGRAESATGPVEAGPVEAGTAEARFRARDELRHSLRSLDLFAPWVNRIWIVTDGQVPAWLDTSHPRVSVVDHREIFADGSVLPTFNSHAIESQLHHIDGLSEHFLYFNDDVFVGRRIGPDMFFTPGGLPHYFLSPTQVPLGPWTDGEDLVFAAAKNNRALIERRFGRTITRGFLHAPHAHRRSTLAQIEREFPDEIAAVMASRMRSSRDISLLSSFAHYYGLLTGRAVAGQVRCTFVNVGRADQRDRLDNLLMRRGYDVFCLNDHHMDEVSADEQARILDAFLGAYFPVASQFERGSARNLRSV
jgi:glycosyltransferase involved in cell wall biosynthesis